MLAEGYRLGIDFGTSNTVAVLAWPDGRAKPLLFDGSPLLPSSVFADAGGGLLVGRDAVHAARAFPERFEPHPKRRIDDGLVLLGDDEIPVQDLIAAVLGRVVAEARRVAGTDAAEVVLTHPAAWGPRRRGVLVAAAQAAGLVGVGLVAEPVAAAAYFREVVGSRWPTDSYGLVFDLGGGTFDATVVRADSDGFAVLATRGLDDAGGLDIDGAIVAHLGATYSARDPQAWQRLAEPLTAADRRASRVLWDDVRAGKETLSRLASTVLHLPLLDEDAPLGREQLDQLARPIIDRSVAAAQAVLRDAEVAPAELTGIFLVGGASRLPLVSTLLHRAIKTAPTVIEQPELVVAEGSLHTHAEFSQLATVEPVPQPAEPVAPVPAAPMDFEFPTPQDAVERSPAETAPPDTDQPQPTLAAPPAAAESPATESDTVSGTITSAAKPGPRAAVHVWATTPLRPSSPHRRRTALLSGLLALALATGVAAVFWYTNRQAARTATADTPGGPDSGGTMPHQPPSSGPERPSQSPSSSEPPSPSGSSSAARTPSGPAARASGGAGGTPAAGPPPSALSPGSVSRIRNVSTDQCVSGDGSVYPGFGTCSSSDAYAWTFQSSGSDTFELVNRASGNCLSAPYAYNNGYAAGLESCSGPGGTGYVQWRIGSTTAAGQTLKNTQTGQCLESAPASYGGGKQVRVTICNSDQPVQLWRSGGTA